MAAGELVVFQRTRKAISAGAAASRPRRTPLLAQPRGFNFAWGLPAVEFAPEPIRVGIGIPVDSWPSWDIENLNQVVKAITSVPTVEAQPSITTGDLLEEPLAALRYLVTLTLFYVLDEQLILWRRFHGGGTMIEGTWRTWSGT